MHSTSCRLTLSTGLALALWALPAAAQESRSYLLAPPTAALTVWGGVAWPQARGEVFDFTFEQLTAARRDFVSPSVGVEFLRPLSDRSKLVIGLTRSAARHQSELRDYVDENDLPIVQTTRFARTTLGGALRYHFVSPGRTFGSFAWIPAAAVPWVSLGGGGLHYRFEQRGEFVDEATLEIFRDRFTSQAWTAYGEGAAGLDIAITPRYALSVATRYLQASGPTAGDFVGFDRINLSGFGVTVGFTVHF